MKSFAGLLIYVPGFSSRAGGLILDTFIGLDVVLANGSFVSATSSSYPDIYWIESRNPTKRPMAKPSYV